MLEVKELPPTATLPKPVVLDDIAKVPTAELPQPLVTTPNAPEPTDTLLKPSVKLLDGLPPR